MISGHTSEQFITSQYHVIAFYKKRKEDTFRVSPRLTCFPVVSRLIALARIPSVLLCPSIPARAFRAKWARARRVVASNRVLLRLVFLGVCREVFGGARK
jgi:hypothetical protein